MARKDPLLSQTSVFWPVRSTPVLVLMSCRRPEQRKGWDLLGERSDMHLSTLLVTGYVVVGMSVNNVWAGNCSISADARPSPPSAQNSDASVSTQYQVGSKNMSMNVQRDCCDHDQHQHPKTHTKANDQ